MSNSCSVENRGSYLRIRVAGENSSENVRRSLKEVYDACARRRIPDVLIEESLEGPPLEPVEVYRVITESSAQTSPVVRKIAYVDLNLGHSQANLRLGEKVARDRGVDVRAFSTSAAALGWLSDS